MLLRKCSSIENYLIHSFLICFHFHGRFRVSKVFFNSCFQSFQILIFYRLAFQYGGCSIQLSDFVKRFLYVIRTYVVDRVLLEFTFVIKIIEPRFYK